MHSHRATWKGVEAFFFKSMSAITGVEASIEDVSFFQGPLEPQGPSGPCRTIQRAGLGFPETFKNNDFQLVFHILAGLGFP